jgi:predicted AlkP superfamily phosphohydrolase/phosphomutase
MPSKIVLLGICAANRDLLVEWANQGLLPNYRSAMQRGLTAYVDSMPGFYVGATWPSFASCVSPARHSRHYILQLVPGTYGVVRNPKGDAIRMDPFWRKLSEAGRKVALFDLPHTAPSDWLERLQVVEWGAHDGDFGQLQTRPEELGNEIDALFGPHPAPRSCDGSKTPEEFAEFRDRLVAGAALRAELTRHYLKKDDWDFFAQVWTEAHCVGHQCWHLHEPSHPSFKDEVVAVTGDPVKDVYVAIDTAIGRVLDAIDSDTTVLLFTGHGMGPKYDCDFFLNDILLRLGHARPPEKQVAEKVSASTNRHDYVDNMLTRGWQHTPRALKQLVQPLRKSVRDWVVDARPAQLPKIDPAASDCFTVKNNAAHSAIRINLEGREPRGQIKPGSEYDALCERLTADVMEIVNLDTGRPIADRVFRTDSVYSGENVEFLPDLLIEWNQTDPISSIGSEKLGRLDGTDPYTRTGDHRKGGILVALGPQIRPGSLNRSIEVTDVGPTIARMLGVELPDVDGTPVKEIASARADALASA